MKKNEKDNPDILFSTYQTKIKTDTFTFNHIKMLTHQSKNLFNNYIYFANLYYKYKYFLIKNFDLSTDFEFYCNNFFRYTNSFKINEVNNIIYEYLLIKCNDIIINTINFFDYYNLFKIECRQLKEVQIFEQRINYCIFTDEIIFRVLRSFYYKKFYKLKNEHNSRIPFSIQNDVLINDVLNNNHINFNVNKEDKNINVSDSTIIKKIVRLNLNSSTNALHCDIKCCVLDKAVESFNGYWRLKEKGLNPGRPRYLDKDAHFILTFNSERNIVIEDNSIHLNLGTNSIYLYPGYIEVSRGLIIQEDLLLDKKGKIDKDKYYYFNKNKMIEKNNSNIKNISNLKIPLFNRIKEKKIRQIEVKINHFRKLLVNITFEREYSSVRDDNIRPVSIDLGLKYLFSIYDYNNTPSLVDSRYLNYINHKYNDLIDNLKSYNKIKYGVDKSKLQERLEKNRKNKINNIFNKTSDWICNRYSNENTLIVGYNKEWKTKVNLGCNTNRKFYQIPYRILLDKIKMKWERAGKQYFEVNEAYTSKCDSLALENIGSKKNYLGKRERRGLFRSSTGILIHADINASINIMRKYYKRENIDFSLQNTNKVNNCYKVGLYHLSRI